MYDRVNTGMFSTFNWKIPKYHTHTHTFDDIPNTPRMLTSQQFSLGVSECPVTGFYYKIMEIPFQSLPNQFRTELFSVQMSSRFYRQIYDADQHLEHIFL